MAKIICNSSPIIGLSIIGKLNLLWEIFDEVYISEAVYQEVVSGNRIKNYGERELREAVKNNNIKIYKVKNKKSSVIANLPWTFGVCGAYLSAIDIVFILQYFQLLSMISSCSGETN